MWPWRAVVLSLQHVVQRPYSIAEAVNKAAGGLLVVTHLHQRADEVKIRYVGRFPLACLRREPISYGQRRPAVVVKNRGVEAEAGAYDYAIVANVLFHLVRTSKAQSHQIGSVPAFDMLNASVEQCVLRLALVGVEEIVVDRAQMADEVRPPGKLD